MHTELEPTRVHVVGADKRFLCLRRPEAANMYLIGSNSESHRMVNAMSNQYSRINLVKLRWENSTA